MDGGRTTRTQEPSSKVWTDLYTTKFGIRNGKDSIFGPRLPSPVPSNSAAAVERGGPKCHVDCRELEIAFRVATGLGALGTLVLNKSRPSGNIKPLTQPWPQRQQPNDHQINSLQLLVLGLRSAAK